MTLRGRILVFLIAGGLAVLALAAIVAVGLGVSGRLVERSGGTDGRLEALLELNAATGHYGRQVVDQLLLRRGRSDDLQSARNDMNSLLAQLARATREEVNSISDQAELQGELPELEKVRSMTDLYHAIDASATRAFTLNAQGDTENAIALLSREVDFRLSNEMQPLIDEGITGERAELTAQSNSLENFRTWIVWAAATVAILALLALALLGAGLYRFAERRLALLAGGANALAAGDLDTPIALAGRDEFAALARTIEGASSALSTERADARAARDRLRTIDAGRSQFLADVGHQLRTPLTVLRGESDVALRTTSTAADLRAAMGRVRDQAAELGLLLDDLINAARLDAEGQPLVLARARLDEIVALAVDEAAVLTEPREIALTTDFADSGIEIDADFRRLKQALMIGIDNAVKHSPPGGAIGIATVMQPGRVAVRISDQGPGILEEDQPRLFERFYRGRLERDLLNPGFGIGLSIAKDIVERHGGTISLSNRPEGGALFEISLPLERKS